MLMWRRRDRFTESLRAGRCLSVANVVVVQKLSAGRSRVDPSWHVFGISEVNDVYIGTNAGIGEGGAAEDETDKKCTLISLRHDHCQLSSVQ